MMDLTSNEEEWGLLLWGKVYDTKLADWCAISTGTFGFDPVNFDDTNALDLPQRFYRIVCH
jgi:hypothetical protein